LESCPRGGRLISLIKSWVIEMSEKKIRTINGWPVISTYTTEQAVEDGVLVYVGDAGKSKVYFTRALFDQGFEDKNKRTELVNRGLDLLRKPDNEDSEYMALRVIEKDKIWVIAEQGKLTYMLPDDY
jgi:hypothetical protein